MIEDNKWHSDISAEKSALYETVVLGCGEQLQYIKLGPSGRARERFMSFRLCFLCPDLQ